MRPQKVFIVQEPMRRNRDTGRLEPFMNLTPAAAYGDLEVLLGRDLTLTPGPMIHELKKRLVDFGDDDFLLGVGDTAAMMAAAIVAAQMNRGVVNILKWNRETSSYIKVRLEV